MLFHRKEEKYRLSLTDKEYQRLRDDYRQRQHALEGIEAARKNKLDLFG